MKAQRPSYLHLIRNELAKFSECRSIFGTLAFIMTFPILFTSCGPQGGSTKNYYQTQMSGGGSTRDPGDGSGGSTGDGGGGQGVLCEDGKLYVRDVYEAIFENNETMKSIPGESSPDKVSPQARTVLVESLKKYFGPSSHIFHYATDKYWVDVENHISFLEDDKELLPSRDANSPIKLKAGCKIVQIAYWDESSRNVKDDKLYVSRKLWNKLDQLNKIALLAHEIFFQQARVAGYKNSDAVRDQVGQLLSVEGLNSLFPNWAASTDPKVSSTLPASMNGFKVCDGTSPDDPNGRIRLYQYEGKDGKQHFSFPIISSTKINSAYLQGGTASFDLEDNAHLAAATDLWLFQTDVDNEEPERYRKDTLERWYSNSGLLSKQPTVTYLFNALGETKTIWSTLLYSSVEPIKITIENSIQNWDGLSQTKLRPAKELVSETNLSIKHELERCERKTDLTEGAIALLHNEIRTAVKAGKYPSTFPKWREALKKLNCPDLLHDTRLTTELPGFLYSIYLKTNTESNSYKVLGDRAFGTRKYSPLPLGTITISQGAEQLTLKLKCEDYKTQYAKKATATVSKNKTLSLDKHVSVNLDAKSYPPLTPTQQTVIRNFQAFLSQKQSESASESFKFFSRRWDEGTVMMIGEFSQDTLPFLTELYTEKSVTLSTCDTYIEDAYPAKSELFGNACVVVTMGTSKNSYTTYVSYYLDKDGQIESVPNLEFVRFLPPIVQSKLNQ